MAQVTLHSRSEAEQLLPDGTVQRVVMVTYSTPQVPPRTISLPVDQASDTQIAQAIRKDVESLPTPSVLEV